MVRARWSHDVPHHRNTGKRIVESLSEMETRMTSQYILGYVGQSDSIELTSAQKSWKSGTRSSEA